MTTVFLSHKTEHAAAAQALAAALGIVVPRDEIFLAEEIRKGDDWRANVDQALTEAARPHGCSTTRISISTRRFANTPWTSGKD